MGYAFTVSWNDAKKGRAARAVVAAVLAFATVSAAGPAVGASRDLVSVIVQKLPGAAVAPERAVSSVGGAVGERIGIIDSFVAEVPADSLGRLRATPGVRAVTPNAPLRLQHAVNGYDASGDVSSMFSTTLMTGAQDYWREGYTGQGVDIALIDSGVAPVDGLTVPGKVVNGADLSFESQAPNLRYLDSNGHGTHLAGIMAGRANGARAGGFVDDHDNFIGMAPDARIVSIKVADAVGATDVSQILAAIDWVVQHRNDRGMNIRVLNLAFGTDSTQHYMLDPLSFAVEVAWRAGIVVVTSAGNHGFRTSSSGLTNPAYNPFVLAVGASDPRGTLSLGDDMLASFSNSGDGKRNPDLVAPGKSIASLRVPNSYIDAKYSGGRVGSTFFRGSGTSQAAAVVSGAAALVLSQHPSLTPDAVKGLLLDSAARIKGSRTGVGSGQLDLTGALSERRISPATQLHAPASGTGSLELARGSVHLEKDLIPLKGEIDIFGQPFVSATWARLAAARSSWSGGMWNGSSWSGSSWSGSSWSGSSWSGVSWSGSSWSGSSWSRSSWSGNSWSGSSWSGSSWSGSSWSRSSWSGSSWSNETWSSAGWA